MIKAVLFDMDGVLIDSEKYISQAAIAYFASLGIKVTPEDFVPFVGSGEDRYLGGVAQNYGVELDIEQAKLDTYDIYEQLIKGKEEALPGVLRFIENAHKAGLLLAIVTSADRRKMEISMEVMGLDPSWFKVLINGKDVQRKKPFADIYQLAATQLQLEAHQCIVFEDAPNGVRSAKAASMLCGALATSFSKEILRTEGADFVINTLDDIEDFANIEQFNTLLLRHRAFMQAVQAKEHAYAPYSNYKVGAAVVSGATKKIYSGANVENSSYGATICAERAAIVKMISEEGKQAIELVIVVTNDNPPAVPCALCLQVFAEFASAKTPVYLCDGELNHRMFLFEELLPHPFVFPSASDAPKP